jgi:hypothetical protein
VAKMMGRAVAVEGVESEVKVGIRVCFVLSVRPALHTLCVADNVLTCSTFYLMAGRGRG